MVVFKYICGLTVYVSVACTGCAWHNSSRRPPAPAVAEVNTAVEPVIVSLKPATGPIGTVVVMTGRNFTSENNVVQFTGEKDFAADSPVGSSNGTSLQFRVTSCPSQQPECPGIYIPPGAYQVSVINRGGRSNSVSFSVVLPKEVSTL